MGAIANAMASISTPDTVQTRLGTLAGRSTTCGFWVTDFGLPGPDRGEGGRYLMVGPGYEGPLPDSGFHVSRVRTTRVCVLGRAFMVDNDPAPAVEAVEAIKAGLEIHPYTRGATAVASFLAGKAPLGAPAARPETTFVDAAHAAFKHDPAERLLLLADDRRARPAGAGRRRRSNGRGQIGR